MAAPEYPLTNKEKYLAKMAGQDVTLPDYPVTRTEQYLDAIAKNGGGGGGGAVVVHIVEADDETLIADKTPQDAWDAMLEGKVVTGVVDMVGKIMPLGTCGLLNGNSPAVCFLLGGDVIIVGGVGEDWEFGSY